MFVPPSDANVKDILSHIRFMFNVVGFTLVSVVLFDGFFLEEKHSTVLFNALSVAQYASFTVCIFMLVYMHGMPMRMTWMWENSVTGEFYRTLYYSEISVLLCVGLMASRAVLTMYM